MDSGAIVYAILGIAGTILASVLGARKGGQYVMESVQLAAKHQRDADDANERREISNLRKALHAEITSLFDRYMIGMGEILESHPDNKPLIIIYPAYQRYFVIFEENSHLIGKIPDDSERELIVRTYNAAKGLLDSYALNNSMTEKHNYAIGLGPVVLGTNYQPVAAEISRMMTDYVPVLKQLHYDTIRLYNELKDTLQREIAW